MSPKQGHDRTQVEKDRKKGIFYRQTPSSNSQQQSQPPQPQQSSQPESDYQLPQLSTANTPEEPYNQQHATTSGPLEVTAAAKNEQDSDAEPAEDEEEEDHSDTEPDEDEEEDYSDELAKGDFDYPEEIKQELDGAMVKVQKARSRASELHIASWADELDGVGRKPESRSQTDAAWQHLIDQKNSNPIYQRVFEVAEVVLKASFQNLHTCRVKIFGEIKEDLKMLLDIDRLDKDSMKSHLKNSQQALVSVRELMHSMDTKFHGRISSRLAKFKEEHKAHLDAKGNEMVDRLKFEVEQYFTTEKEHLEKKTLRMEAALKELEPLLEIANTKGKQAQEIVDKAQQSIDSELEKCRQTRDNIVYEINKKLGSDVGILVKKVAKDLLNDPEPNELKKALGDPHALAKVPGQIDDLKADFFSHNEWLAEVHEQLHAETQKREALEDQVAALTEKFAAIQEPVTALQQQVADLQTENKQLWTLVRHLHDQLPDQQAPQPPLPNGGGYPQPPANGAGGSYHQ